MGEVPQDVNPIAAFHPQFGLMSMIMPTNLDSSEKQIQLGAENMDSGKLQLDIVQGPKENTDSLDKPGGQIVVHGREGPFLMDKSKWPTLTLPRE